MDNAEEKTTRIRIPGPISIFQTDRIQKLRSFKDDTTQEYIRKHNFDDMSEDDDFQSSPWVKVLEFMNDRKKIRGGCFGDIESYLKKGKLEIVVAIINSCKLNVLGDMNVTLKDPLVKHGLLIWPTVEENGVTRTKKYVELSAAEKIQADCDMKVTNIILQGIPSDIYLLVNHHRVSKDLWERI
nr:hypothetical protein [Tanacetum cinerariifolium]